MPFGLFFFPLLLTLGAATEDACPPTEVIKFAELYANPHLHPCQKVSAGFSMAPPTGYPTDPQIKALCGSKACRALIKDVFALKPADCFLSFAGVKLNAYKMASSVQDACDAEKSHENNTLASTSDPVSDPVPKSVGGDEHDSTPKPTKHNKQNSTLSEQNSTLSERNSTLSDNDEIQVHVGEPMVIENMLDNQHCPMQNAEKETVEEAGSLMPPPMNGTAFGMFPMPNMTYKATVKPSV